MRESQPNNPLHGVTLEQLLNELVSFYGWDALGRKIEIRFQQQGPTFGESLKQQGLNSLAEWSASTGKPGITGLIVDKTALMPAGRACHQRSAA